MVTMLHYVSATTSVFVWLDVCVNDSVCFCDCCDCVMEIEYSGQGSPVHACTADVEMSPVDHPEGGQEVAFGQRRHVHIVHLSTFK